MLPRWPTNGFAPCGSSPAPSRKRVRTLPQLTNAGCTVDTTSLAEFILELVLMVRTCVVNDRGRHSNARRWQTLLGLAFTQLQQHCNQLAGFPSCQVSKLGAPMHQPSFLRRSRQVQGRRKQLLRANGLVGDLTRPGYTSKTILSGNPPYDATR